MATEAPPPRCGKILRVPEKFSMVLPGDYACTLPKGHKPADEHVGVMRWKEPELGT